MSPALDRKAPGSTKNHGATAIPVGCRTRFATPPEAGGWKRGAPPKTCGECPFRHQYRDKRAGR